MACVIEATQSAASPGESARKTSDDFCNNKYYEKKDKTF